MTLLKVAYTEFPVPSNEAFPNQQIKYIPVLRTALKYRDKTSDFYFLSLIDSGADNCVFPAIYGRRLGIAVETGRKYPYAGASGVGVAYFHDIDVLVTIEKEVYSFKCYCGFADALTEIGVGLLGRHGFFELFKSIKFSQNHLVVDFELKT